MNDCLFGFYIRPEDIKPQVGTAVEYFHETLGTVKIGHPTYMELANDNQFLKYPESTRAAIAGITKNAFISKGDTPLIDASYLNRTNNVFSDIPAAFNEKWHVYLRFLYNHGGSEYRNLEINTMRDFAVSYSTHDDFRRIIEYLVRNQLITIGLASNQRRKANDNTWSDNQDDRIYYSVKITNEGVAEVEKLLPKIPLISLVNQEITTGNKETDEKIMHAKDLFFKQYATMDNKRSACEALSHVLEPWREDLKNYFSTSDVSDFFNIVNTFDIRHNKSFTRNLVHEEQLEWVFFTLLNTISVYVKLKRKMGS